MRQRLGVDKRFHRLINGEKVVQNNMDIRTETKLLYNTTLVYASTRVGQNGRTGHDYLLMRVTSSSWFRSPSLRWPDPVDVMRPVKEKLLRITSCVPSRTDNRRARTQHSKQIIRRVPSRWHTHYVWLLAAFSRVVACASCTPTGCKSVKSRLGVWTGGGYETGIRRRRSMADGLSSITGDDASDARVRLSDTERPRASASRETTGRQN